MPVSTLLPIRCVACLLLALASFIATPSLHARDLGFATERPEPPNGWVRLPWEQKREILFGIYAPNEQEQELIQSAAAKATVGAKPKLKTPKRIFVYYRCEYPHASIATGRYAVEQLGELASDIEVTVSEDPADFNLDTLMQFDAVLLLNTTSFEQAIGAEGQQALLSFLKSGRGLAGIHAAADSCKGWQPGSDVIGGIFSGHPWLPLDAWAIRLESPQHPLNAAFDGKGFWLKDEIYYYRPGSHSRERSRVLLSLDMQQPHNSTSKKIPERLMHLVDVEGDYPIAWAHQRAGGRVFYSNLGHNPSTYWQPAVLRHYLDGIRYAAGTLEADVTPSAQLEKTDVAPAPDRE